jgi:predicted nucleic acid-binding protein
LIQSSWLLIPEAHAALARARRDRRLSPAGAARGLEVLSGLLAEVEALELDEGLAERAGELATTFGLRGSDAVHLASYERVESEDSMLVAADGALARAALSLGHAVAVPAA